MAELSKAADKLDAEEAAAAAAARAAADAEAANQQGRTRNASANLKRSGSVMAIVGAQKMQSGGQRRKAMMQRQCVLTHYRAPLPCCGSARGP